MTQQGPGVPPPPPWGQPPLNPWAAPPAPAPPPRVVNRLVVAFVLLGLGCAVLAGYGLGSAHRRTVSQDDTTSVTFVRPGAPSAAPTTPPAPIPALDGISEYSPLTATSGELFFTDNFHDASRGWDTGSDKNVTTRLVHPGYQTTIRSDWVETIPSPFTDGVWQLGQSVTAVLAKGFGRDSSVGLSCERDYDKTSDLAYQFEVDTTGFWGVYRLDKANLPSSTANELAGGETTAAGLKPLTVAADCVTLPDLRTQRLVMFVNGHKMADFTDTTPAGDEGWAGAMFNGGDAHATTIVTASLYSESTLYADAPIGTST